MSFDCTVPIKSRGAATTERSKALEGKRRRGVYFIVVFGPLGFVLTQNAFHTGVTLPPALAVLTVAGALAAPAFVPWMALTWGWQSPFVAAGVAGLLWLFLWVPLYNRVEPTFIGMPFFYWFQLLLVLVGAALTAIIYFATEKK